MANVSKITPAEFGQDCEPKEVLADLLEKYRKPSFGSMSKRDVDIMMFEALQDLGIIKANPKIYDVMQLLHVTRAKARNLIYEVALRRTETEEYLKKQLCDILNEGISFAEKGKVTLEIDNPLVIDYLRKELKDLKHLTDGSFSPELVKMSNEAFADLYWKEMEGTQKEINAKLKKLGMKESGSQAVLGILQEGLIAAVGTVAGESLGTFTEQLINKAIKAYKDRQKEKEREKSKQQK